MADPWGNYQQGMGLLGGLALNPAGMDPEQLRQIMGILAPPVQAPGLGVPAGLLGGRMAQNAATGAVDAAMLPGDVYQGKVDLSSPEGADRVANMATTLMTGGMPMAEAGAAGIFGGRLAKTANLDALKEAEVSAAKGSPKEEIWNQTGWFQGPDQQWRFEIPDSISHFKGTGLADELTKRWGDTAKDVFYHPDLYKAYPELGDAKITTRNVSGVKGAYYSPDPVDGTPAIIALNYRGGSAKPNAAMRSVLGGDMRSTMLHEMQHGVQDIEGFPQGGNPEMTYQMIKPSNPQAWELYQSALAKPGPLTEEIFKQIAPTRDYQDYIKQYAGDAKNRVAAELYKRLGGEVEARNVQARADLSPEGLLAKPPWETQDVPFQNQLVKKRR